MFDELMTTLGYFFKEKEDKKIIFFFLSYEMCKEDFKSMYLCAYI